MIRRTGRFAGFAGDGCGCAACAGEAAPAFGGIFSTILNAAGSFVGDPGLGSQIAATAGPGWAAISETPEEIAARVAQNVAA
jgi:hypothetical protein